MSLDSRTSASPLSPTSFCPLLRLVPISLAAIESEIAQDGRLGDLLGAEITAEWPPADWEPHVLALVRDGLLRKPEHVGFHRYVLLSRPRRAEVLIGCVGAFLWPDRPGEVDIGYSTLPAFRYRGYATAAAREHVAWLLARPENLAIMAQTFPHLEASVRILQRLGFVRDGQEREDGTIVFRLNR